MGVKCNSQNRQKPREISRVALSPVCQQSSLWLSRSNLKVRANRKSPLTDLRILLLTEDVWESQRLGNGVHILPPKCFYGCRRRKWMCTHKNCEIFSFPAIEEGSMAKVSCECKWKTVLWQTPSHQRVWLLMRKRLSIRDSRALPHFAWRRLKGTRQSRAAGGAPGARPQTLLFTNVGCVKTKAHPH